MLYVNYPSWLNPEIISGLPVRWYGLMYLVAFVTAYFFIVTLLKYEKKDVFLVERMSTIFCWIIIGILLGGRIVSEVIYSKNFLIFIKPWQLLWPFDSNMNFVGIQGMSYHGGFIGGFLGGFLCLKKYKIPIWKLADKLFMGACLGYGFGRLGNFTNAELFGRITSSPLGMVFPGAQSLPYGDERVKAIADTINMQPDNFGLVNLPRHASQLYEAFFESAIVFIILFVIYTKIKNTKYYLPGMFVGLYIIGYGLARFFVEYFRQPDANLGFVLRFSKEPNPIWLYVSPVNFTMGQILSVFMILGGLLLIYILHLARKKSVVL